MNTHSVNDDETDIDALETLTTSHASSISSINSSVTTINNKLSGSSSSGLKTLTTTNLNGINGILNHTTDSNLKAFVDANSAKTGITSVQSNNILNNNDKIGITLSQISAISANTNRYPQFTNLKRLYNQDGDIYNDGKIKFRWNSTYRQLMFYVLDIGASEYLTGGVVKNEGSTRTAVHTYLTQGESTAYKYFTTPQTGASQSIVNSTFNLTTSYSRIEYFLHPYNEFAYPSYRITILIGSSSGYHQISIKKFSD